MTPELFWLIACSLLTGSLWMPYILGVVATFAHPASEIRGLRAPPRFGSFAVISGLAV